ncbi:MAG: glycosyltransferase [Sulfuricellaceae bacterium]
MQVHLLVERDRYGNPHGSGQIRLLRPFSHPSLTECIQTTAEDDLPRTGADVVIVERGWRADATLESVETLVAAIRKQGAKLIYTLDDNLLDLHRGQPWHEFSTDLKRNIVRYLLRQADGVIVSTQALKQRLLKLNANIYVVPNALDERLFLNGDTAPPAPEKPAMEPLIIGYMGTHSHLLDLMMVLEPLRAILREYRGKIEFQLLGVAGNGRAAQCFDALPFRVLDTEGNHFYPDFVPWAKEHLRWDMAIAPLEDNEFTRCKSDIKFLDYALLGIPAVYSNVEAYRHTVEHGKSGLLCDNTPKAWRSALSEMAESSALRHKLALSAYEFASTYRLLRQSALDWKVAISAIAGMPCLATI